MSARRYTEGKLRFDLIPKEFKEALALVYTIGAEKYTIRDGEGNIIDDGANNWRRGFSWMQTLSAAYRHLHKFEKGEDFDEDYPEELVKKYGKTLHLANAAWGIASLITFYKIHPQGDDRLHKYLSRPKIGLDVDEVLADWVGHWTAHHGQEIPEAWNFDRHIKAKFEELQDDKDFWLSIPAKVRPMDIGFEPHCYVTSRSVPQSWTEEWLDKNGFPQVPVYSIGHGVSKVETVRASGCDIFVDDRFDNFVELNKAGICCYLFDAKHNSRYDVGYKRIKDLRELTM